MQMEFFSRVKDPRVLGKVKHELEDVLRLIKNGVNVSTPANIMILFSLSLGKRFGYLLNKNRFGLR